MIDDRFRAGRAAQSSAILDGDGATTKADRQAAYDGATAGAAADYIDTVRRNAYRVTDQQVAELRAAGRSESEVFELTVAAAVGQATRQYDHALAALATALAEVP